MWIGEKAKYPTRGTRRHIHLTLPLLFCCLLFTFAATATSAKGLVTLDTETGFQAVYVHEDPDATEILVSVTLLAGEVDATGPEGLSHYLEHLMFWHADKINDAPFHDRGGNAWVNGFITNYFNISEESSLEDMLEFAARLFSKPELDRSFMVEERGIVAREYDLRYLENPERKVFNLLRKSLYGEVSVSRSTMGTPATIGALKILQALDYHNRYYHPANAVLFVSGNVDANAIEPLINKKLGSIPAGPRHSPDWRNERISKGEDLVIKASGNSSENHRLLYMSLSQWGDGENSLHNVYTADLLAAVLNSALPGSLAIPLRMENFIVSDYELYLFEVLKDHFELTLTLRADDGVTWQVVDSELRSALASIAESGIPAKTLERVRKRSLQTQKRVGMDYFEAWARAQGLLTYGIQPITLAEHLQRIESVTLNDINGLLKALVSPQRRASAYVLPEEN